ncbi:hypothetical protein BH11CYA1_BH11CYA1_13770 [soil metagenome]
MSESSKLPDILLPEGINYSCQGCGRCCSGWSVGMTENDYNRVKDIDWKALYPELASKQLFIHREKEFAEGTAGYPHYTAPTEGGSCPFLVDNLCTIHSHLGEAAKPVACRIFPYTFAETPTGIYTGVSFASMAAIRNIGDPLTEQKEMFENYFKLVVEHKNDSLLPEARAAQELALAAIPEGSQAVYTNPFETVSLTPACQVSWAEYLLIENRMIAIILERLRRADEHPEDCSIFKTLLLCSEVLTQGRKFKLANGDMNQITDFTPELKQPIDVTPSGIELMTLRMLFYRFFVYATVRTSDTRLWQMQKGSNAMITAKMFKNYAGSGIQTIFFGKTKLPNLGNVNLDKALMAKFKSIDPETNKLFHRWIYLKLFSKSYFGPAAASFSVLSGFNSLIAGLLSVLIYSKAAAINKKENETSIVETYDAFWRLNRELQTISQIPAQESRMYNAGLSAPRLFNKAIWALSIASGDKI